MVMHEVSVALSLLELAEKKCREAGYHSIDAVKVRVGKASGVLPEALSFALDMAKKDTLAGNAQFVIEVIPLGGSCNGCGRNFTMEENFIFACPHCASPSLQILRGRELELVEMEVN